MTSNKSGLAVLASIMSAFFVMGFVDMVGTATNYVKADFGLSDTMANFLPSMVFLWFFFLAVPISLMMNRIGKRRTVLLSLVLTCVSMVLPLLSYTYPMMLVSFCLLGLGNAFMQVSLNPVLSCVVSEDKFAGTLTFGQFIKAIASLSAPVLASLAAVRFGNWLFIYPVFMGFSLVAAVCMWVVRIEEEMPVGKTSGFFVFDSLAGLYAAIALVGFGNSNIFPMIFSKALFYKPEWGNEMSGLMIMGLIGGTVFPLLMGILSDALGSQTGSVAVVSLGVVYLVFLSYRFWKGEVK